MELDALAKLSKDGRKGVIDRAKPGERFGFTGLHGVPFLNLTPAPPPFSAMNSTRAVSRASWFLPKVADQNHFIGCPQSFLAQVSAAI